MKDPKYGIPQLKKFPMPDARHVRSAIKFFNYAPPKYEKQLAAAILRRMKEYGLSFDDFTVGDENRFKRYVPKTYLAHHGILGQKWGQRNGPPYPLSDSAHSSAEKRSNYKQSIYAHRVKSADNTRAKVDSIINSMNKDDRDKVLAGSDHYLNFEEGSAVVKRVLKEVGDIPVSFFDLLEEDKDTLQVALGTRSGSEFRGKGYANSATDQAMTWLDKNKKKLTQKQVIWGVRVDNPGSIRIAEKHGFEIDPDSYSDDGLWVNYIKRIR